MYNMRHYGILPSIMRRNIPVSVEQQDPFSKRGKTFDNIPEKAKSVQIKIGKNIEGFSNTRKKA